MDKLAKWRNHLRVRRKLSLPMLIGQFHGTPSSPGAADEDEEKPKRNGEAWVKGETLDAAAEDVPQMAAKHETDPAETCQIKKPAKEKEEAVSVPSRRVKRWPSTPSFQSKPVPHHCSKSQGVAYQPSPTVRNQRFICSPAPPEEEEDEGSTSSLIQDQQNEVIVETFSLPSSTPPPAHHEDSDDQDGSASSYGSSGGQQPDVPETNHLLLHKEISAPVIPHNSDCVSPKLPRASDDLIIRGAGDRYQPGLRGQSASAVAISLPAINCLSDCDVYEADKREDDIATPKSSKRNTESKKVTKLKRRKAYYKHQKDGRSKSLTHIDTLDPAMLVRREDGGNGGCDAGGTGEAGDANGFLLAERLGVHPSISPVVVVPSSLPGGGDSAGRRRRLSNVYKVTSSEYFSVSFECFEDPGPEEFIAATKGTSLREALSGVCERRGVDLNSVDVYLDSSKTPLSLITTETFWLGGKHLRIKSKDGPKSPVRGGIKPMIAQQTSRKGSGSYRSTGKHSRALSGATSTEDPTGLDWNGMVGVGTGSLNNAGTVPGSGSNEGSLKAKGAKPSTRWSGLFSTSYKDTKMDSLVEQLNDYSRHGIPRLPHLLTFEADEAAEEALYSLEEDWKNIVEDWTALSERQKQQQNAIWELVQTEVAYIRTLKVITDLFMACLCNLQIAQILNEIDTERLFSNIPEIYIANRQFWAEAVLPMLQKARAAKVPLDPTVLKDAFLKFDEIFHPYTKYCLDQTQCQQYCKEKDHDNELFKAYLAWCETQRDCNRLRLMDILVKPMQRLTKYSLLLKAVHKKTDDDVHKIVVTDMIQAVESFVGHVNSALRQRHEQERLREIISRIESYDAVEAKDEELERIVRAHCDLDLTRPMPGCSEHQRRHLLTEGDLKLKDQTSSKVDVHCFLFTDVLLVCKPVAKKAEKVKVIRPPFLVDRLVVAELVRDPTALGLVYLNEMGTAAAAFSLYAPEPKQCKSWSEHLRKAAEGYKEAKLAALAVQTDSIFFVPDEDDDIDFPSSALLVARSPRGSSRGSRGSSLIHSHRQCACSYSNLSWTNSAPNLLSGSVDMNEPLGGGPGRNVSFELVEGVRASSASSDDSSAPATGIAGEKSSKDRCQPSPRPERRSFLTRQTHTSPNTLTVQVPHIVPSHQGQSLPNLLSLAIPVPTPNMVSSLSVGGSTDSGSGATVPSSQRSNIPLSQRGVSYPPPSPRGLTRTQPVPQSHNPPLMKMRRLGSCVVGDGGSTEPFVEAVNPNVALDVPLAVSDDNPTGPDSGIEAYTLASEMDDAAEESARKQLLNAALAKRLSRNDRLDSRRYHTAGAIEDIKKQDLRDTSIHKRLSWNYGQHLQSGVKMNKGMMGGVYGPADSMLSFSSSGVSSTGSLHLSTASEAEIDDMELERISPRINEIINPHVSSTYITHDGSSDPVRSVEAPHQCLESRRENKIFQTESIQKVPPVPPPRSVPIPVPSALTLPNDLRIDISEVCDGISSVQITVSGADGASARPSRLDLLRMKDLILSDASMEASEV